MSKQEEASKLDGTWGTSVGTDRSFLLKEKNGEVENAYFRWWYSSDKLRSPWLWGTQTCEVGGVNEWIDCQSDRQLHSACWPAEVTPSFFSIILPAATGRIGTQRCWRTCHFFLSWTCLYLVTSSLGWIGKDCMLSFDLLKVVFFLSKFL